MKSVKERRKTSNLLIERMTKIVGIKVAKGEGGSSANGRPNSLSGRRFVSESDWEGSEIESVGGWRSDSGRNRNSGEAERRKRN